jgi:putative MATE family efflux protein
MAHDFSKDLTQGGVAKNLVAFALPLMASTLLQALYNTADLLIVGIFTDAAGLSGVAIGGQLTILVTNVVIGLASGGTILISQYRGAKRLEEERRAIGTLLGGLLAMAALTSLCLPFLAGPLARLMDAPPESYSQARDYLAICMGGSAFIFGYNALSSIMRGLGDSKRPFLFVGIATGTNVVLDLLAVGALRLGAAGAAWATVISQAFSLILSAVYLGRRGFRFSLRIHGPTLKRLLGLGLPMGLQQLIVQVSFVFLSYLVNGYGVSASAAAGICAKVNSFAILPGLAMSAAISAMAGQNIGAQRFDRAMQTLLTGLKVILPLDLAIFIAVNIFTAGIIGAFSVDPGVIGLGVIYMRYVSVDALIVMPLFCLSGLLIGAGRTGITLFTSFFSSILLRMPLAWLFSRSLGLGFQGVGLGTALAPAGALAFSIIYLATGRWKRSAIGEPPVQGQSPAMG